MMDIHAEKISAEINRINSDSTRFAEEKAKAGISTGKLKPFKASFTAFMTTFLHNTNRFTFQNRLTDSYLASFSAFAKYLKLLKLNNRF